MDIIINVAGADIFEINSSKIGESSDKVALRVKKARELQNSRYENDIAMKDIACKTNSKAKESLIEKYVKLDQESQKVLKQSFKETKASMRSYNRILRVARTIADLDQREDVNKYHILEALNYKKLVINGL